MTSFQIEVHGDDDRCIVAPRGEVDIATVDQVDEILLPLVVDGTPPLVIVDLRGVVFMDSSGLRSLLTCRERLERQRRRLALVRGPRAVMRVFDITSTAALFEIVNRPSEAGGAVQSPPWG